MKRISSVLLCAILFAATADAQRVVVVSVGNQTLTDGWCDVNVQSLAAGASRSYSISGKIDGQQNTSINGKFRLKSPTDKFEWTNGEPAVAFTQSSSSPLTFSIKAKATAVAGTHLLSFVAVDDAGTESSAKTCKITVSGVAAKPDLTDSLTHVRKEGGGDTDWLTSPGDIAGGTKPMIRVKVKNTRSNVPSPAVKVVVNRFDHTCGGYPVAVGSASVDALAGGASVDKEFTENNPPAPDNDPSTAIGSSVVVCYKASLQTAGGGYYSDSINSNNTSTRYVKFVATSTTVVAAAKFGDYLFAQFSNAKCVNCHAFTDPNSAKRVAHNSRIATGADVTNPTTCSGCHTSSPTCTGAPGCVADWHAAPASANWTGKAATQMCEHVKTAALPAGKTMSSHLKTDTFVLWALGKMGTVMSTWNAKVDEWINGGMKCS
jgi:hypothetical protein